MNKEILKETEHITNVMGVILNHKQRLSTRTLIGLDEIAKHIINIENIAKYDNKERVKKDVRYGQGSRTHQ